MSFWTLDLDARDGPVPGVISLRFILCGGVVVEPYGVMKGQSALITFELQVIGRSIDRF